MEICCHDCRYSPRVSATAESGRQAVCSTTATTNIVVPPLSDQETVAVAATINKRSFVVTVLLHKHSVVITALLQQQEDDR